MMEGGSGAALLYNFFYSVSSTLEQGVEGLLSGSETIKNFFFNMKKTNVFSSVSSLEKS